MKTVKYVPAACKGEEATFEGHLELRPVTFDEKYSYIEDLGLQMDDTGKVELGDTLNRMRLMRKMAAISKSHYVAVSLKKKSNGETYENFDELSSDNDAHGIIMEVGNLMLEGFSLGKA